MASGGAIVFLSLPLLVGLFMENHGMAEAEAWVIASAYFSTYLLASASSVLWVNRLSCKLLGGLAYGLMAFGLALAAVAAGISLLTVGMCIAGVGGGMLFSLGVGIIAAGPDTDRNYGWLLVAQQLVAAAFLLFVPTLVVPVWDLGGALLSLALLAILFSPSLHLVGSIRLGSTSGGGENPVQVLPRVRVLFALGALVVHFAGLSSLWAFVERIGEANGLANAEVGQALSLSMLGGLAGALAVTQLGNRIGRQLPLWLSTLAFAAVTIAYGLPLKWASYFLITALLSFAWNFVLAYQMSIVSDLGNGEAGAVLIPAAQGLGAVIGPVMGGAILGGLGQTALLASVGLICVGTIVVFSTLARGVERQNLVSPGT